MNEGKLVDFTTETLKRELSVLESERESLRQAQAQELQEAAADLLATLDKEHPDKDSWYRNALRRIRELGDEEEQLRNKMREWASLFDKGRMEEYFSQEEEIDSILDRLRDIFILSNELHDYLDRHPATQKQEEKLKKSMANSLRLEEIEKRINELKTILSE